MMDKKQKPSGTCSCGGAMYLDFASELNKCEKCGNFGANIDFLLDDPMPEAPSEAQR